MDRNRRSPRGTSLIEAMIALTVLLIGMAGLAGLVVQITRADHFAKRMSAATLVATDLSENIHRWSYSDSRLVPAGPTISACSITTLAGCFTNASIAPMWDMGTTAAPYANAYTPHYSNSDLGAWKGVSGDVDRDGTTDFFRYWNVFEITPGPGLPSGKLVQIIVRWKEPNYGFRQVVTSTFKLNPAALAQ